jgi:hypothetical protein
MTRVPAANMPGQPASAEMPDTRGTGTRVLLVDDDFAVADSTAMLLELKGYTVCIAHTGHAALEQMPIFRPQIVLLDIGMKGMDGFETAKRLRQLPECRDLCVVALTGYADGETRARALVSGCDHFLVKPLCFDVLNRLLASVI